MSSNLGSIFPIVCFHGRRSVGLRLGAQFVLLLFVLCGFGQASGQQVAQVVPSIRTIAGNYAAGAGYSGDSGPATSAELYTPYGVAVDSAGNLYIADVDNNRIREVSAGTGVITTVAGNGTQGYNGDGEAATSAELNNPIGVTVDAAGNLYIVDLSNYRVRKVAAGTGIITTVAGNGTQGYSGNGAAATSASLYEPYGVAVDSAGNLYISDIFMGVVREVSAATGIITTVAGTGSSGYNGDGIAATSAELCAPIGLAVDAAGNLYIADVFNDRVRKVAAGTGIITTVAGNGTQGYSGDGAVATSAELDAPSGVVLDSAGNLYIADEGNSRIREVSAGTGIITTVAGNGTPGYSGDTGPATSAELSVPAAVALDSGGDLYITDAHNNVIREVSANTTFPTTAVGSTSASQNVLVQFNVPVALTNITAAQSQGGKQEYTVGTISGTGCTVGGTPITIGAVCTVPVTFQPAYSGNRGVSLQVTTSIGSSAYTFPFGLNGVGTGPQVALTPGTMTTVAGTGAAGYSGNGGAATGAVLNNPAGAAVDSAGNLYFPDSGNNVIWKVSPTTGLITIVAGNGTMGFSGDGGLATSAQLTTPYQVAVDSAGNLYIADTGNVRIREVSATTGLITTVAGDGMYGDTGDGGAATSATFNGVSGVTVDSAGNLYIADYGNGAIRKVFAGSGLITTVAGNGTMGYGGDGGLATSAELAPMAVAVDGVGDLYIADYGNNRIREVSAGTGLITTVAGNGTAGYSGDNGLATGAALNAPFGIAVDGASDLYITDSNNNRIREVFAGTGVIATVAGNGTGSYSGDGGGATSAALNSPAGIALDGVGNLYFADSNNNRIREVEVTVPPTLTFQTATNVGSTDSMDGPQTIAISNIGNAALTLPTPTTGANPSVAAGFTLDSSSSCLQLTSAGTLVPGMNCTFAVDFAPTVAGTISGSLVLTDNTLNAVAPNYATQTIALNGTAVTAAVAPTLTTPTLTFAPIATQTEGAAPFAVSATSASSGAVTYAVTSGPATIAGNMVTVTGTGTVVLTASQAASGNYTAATATITFSVGLPFTLAPATGTTARGTGTTASVAPGLAATFSLTLAPAGATTFPDPITFSVTGLPPGATATFSPATIAAGSKVTPVTLTIQTATTTTARNEEPTSGNPLAPVALGFLLLPLLGLKAARERLRQMPRLPAVLLGVGLSLGAVLGISGCSGGSATPAATTPTAQSYTVQAIATDTTTKAQSMIPLTLTVQ
jgi:sugar lactone lactonase YvrE